LLGSIDTFTAPSRDGPGYEVRHADSGQLIAKGRSMEEADARARDRARQLGRRRMVAWLQSNAGSPWGAGPSNGGQAVNIDDLDDTERHASVANVVALGPSASPEDIARAQSIAKQDGFDVGAMGIDGKWGERTRAALHDWLAAPYDTESAPAQSAPPKVSRLRNGPSSAVQIPRCRTWCRVRSGPNMRPICRA
jgi:hypothetical protein